MLDLHLHTTYSDGLDSPVELLKKVANAGVEVFSVTDHDKNVAGIFKEIAYLRKEKIFGFILHLSKEHNFIIPDKEIKDILSLEDPRVEHIKAAIYKYCSLPFDAEEIMRGLPL